MAVAAIPWREILKAIPFVVDSAQRLWQHWSEKPKARPIDPDADLKTQLVAAGERLSALEAAEMEQAKLVAQMAEQLEAVARKAKTGYWLSVSGFALSCVALVLALR